MDITSIANEPPAAPVGNASPLSTKADDTASDSSSQSQVPVSVYSAEVDGQTEGVRVSEVSGTYFAEVAGPPSVTTSGSSLASAEDRLAYIVNLFA